jgi:hypothetical protein
MQGSGAGHQWCAGECCVGVSLLVSGDDLTRRLMEASQAYLGPRAGGPAT